MKTFKVRSQMSELRGPIPNTESVRNRSITLTQAIYMIYYSTYKNCIYSNINCSGQAHNINLPCINSNNLLTTVFRNFQCARRNLGYCPTTYMILDAIMALLSFPFFCSQRPSKSLITVTRNLFSSSSCIAPDILPMAQQSC